MLTEKKRIFCREYCVDFNGAAAAERAGYKKSRAKETASRLLTEKGVMDEISAIIKARNSNTEDAAQKVIKELEVIAYARTTDFIKIKDITIGRGRDRRKVRVVYAELTSDVDEEKQKAIAEIRQTKDGVALKSHDKVKALELLGKHYGIFEIDNKQRKAEIHIPGKITHNLIVKKCDK